MDSLLASEVACHHLATAIAPASASPSMIDGARTATPALLATGLLITTIIVFAMNSKGDVSTRARLVVGLKELQEACLLKASSFCDISIPIYCSSGILTCQFCLKTYYCLNDGTPKVRDASFAVLATVAKMVGMRPLERYLEKLDEVREKKLLEMIGSSSGGAVSKTGTGQPCNSGRNVSSHEVFSCRNCEETVGLLTGKLHKMICTMT